MTACHVYRCSRQEELYLYLRADLDPASLPEPLLKRAGKLLRVMELQLDPARKLARVDVTCVIAALQGPGYFLQMPPDGHIRGHLDDGD